MNINSKSIINAIDKAFSQKDKKIRIALLRGTIKTLLDLQFFSFAQAFALKTLNSRLLQATNKGKTDKDWTDEDKEDMQKIVFGIESQMLEPLRLGQKEKVSKQPLLDFLTVLDKWEKRFILNK